MKGSDFAILVGGIVVIAMFFAITDTNKLGQATQGVSSKRIIYVGQYAQVAEEVVYIHTDMFRNVIANSGEDFSEFKLTAFESNYASRQKNYGNINLGKRDYDSDLKRFLLPDPELNDWNSPYNYLENNPFKKYDPTGGKSREVPKDFMLASYDMGCGSACAYNPQARQDMLKGMKIATKGVISYIAEEVTGGGYTLYVVITGDDPAVDEYGLSAGDRALTAIGLLPLFPGLRHLGRGLSGSLNGAGEILESRIWRGDFADNLIDGAVMSKYDQVYGFGEGEKLFYRLSPEDQDKLLLARDLDDGSAIVTMPDGSVQEIPTPLVPWTTDRSTASYYSRMKSMSGNSEVFEYATDGDGILGYSPFNANGEAEVLTFSVKVD